MSASAITLTDYIEHVGNNVFSAIRSVTESEGYKAQATKIFNFTQNNRHLIFFGAFCYHCAYELLICSAGTALGFWSEKHVRIQAQEKSKSFPIDSFFQGSEPKTYYLLVIIAVRYIMAIQISALLTGFFIGMTIRKLLAEPPPKA